MARTVLPRLRGYRLVHVHPEGEACDWGCSYAPTLRSRFVRLLRSRAVIRR